MSQLGIFESSFAYGRLDKCTDPLLKLNGAIDWELFRPQLESIRRNGYVGRKAFDFFAQAVGEAGRFDVCERLTILQNS